MVWLDYHNGVIMLKIGIQISIDADMIWILVLALVNF